MSIYTPTWPKIINPLGSTTAEFGGEWGNLVSDYFNGVNIGLIDPTKKPKIGTPTTWKFETLGLLDNDESHKVWFSIDDIDTGVDRIIKIRRMNSPNTTDYMVMENMSQALSGKSMNFGSGVNTATNIPSTAIADDAVTNDKIADSAVNTNQLADGSVTVTKIHADTWSLVSNPIERIKKWFVVEDDFVYPDSSNPFNTSTSGVAATIDTTSDAQTGHPGIWELETGTDTTGWAGVGTNDGGPSAALIGEGEITYILIAKLDTLSNGTDRYTTIFGLTRFIVSSNTAFDHGVFFRYKDDVNTGKWQAVCRVSDTETAVDTGATADTNWHVFKIVINAAGTSVAFYIDGTQTSNSPITTNIPTGTQATYPNASIEKSLGTTNRLVFLDYMGEFQKLTTARFT